jgi:hypothetical protein
MGFLCLLALWPKLRRTGFPLRPVPLRLPTSDADLSRIAEQVGEDVAVVDNDAWIIYVNAAFGAMHRCAPEPLHTTKGSAL